MSRSDSQFKAFIRFLLDAAKELQQEPDEKKKSEKLQRIIDNLQKTLED